MRARVKNFLKSNLFMLVFLVSALATLVVSAMTIISMSNTVRIINTSKENVDLTAGFVVRNYELRLKSAAAAAQNLITADEMNLLRPGPDTPVSHDAWLEDSVFRTLRERLSAFTAAYGLEFVYYYFRIDNYFQPVIDNDPDPVKAYTPANELLRIDEEARIAWNGKRIVIVGVGGNAFIDSDGLMTAYAPVLANDGEVTALVGVDILDEQIYLLRDQASELTEQAVFMSRRISYLISGMIVALFLVLAGGLLTFIANRKRTAILEDTLIQAEHASRAKGDFLANMSHELRTPLNAALGMTSIALNTEDVTRKDYCLKKIEEAASHLLDVINDVLDFSKIESARFELSGAEFDFKKMLKKVCDTAASGAADKQQTFDVDVSADIPDVLMGDEQHVAQAITSFLSNAVKFTPQGGSLSLKACVDGEKDDNTLVRVEVSDNGIGISQEQMEHLFHPFEQADSGTTKRFSGTGLGLVIAKRIIESMSGQIVFHSVHGQGSTFGFIAPFKRVQGMDNDTESITEAIEDAQDDFSQRCILLADDVEINREIVLAMLEPTNVMIDCAENGAIALKMFTDTPERYDIIFMDVQMPEMDGYEATRRIRALASDRAKRIPIIAMTANAYREDIQKALSAGMNAHVAKPIDMNGVMQILRRYLNH